jgi:hypothetical protein
VSRHRFILLFAAILFFYVLVPVVHQLRELMHPEWPPFLEGVFFVALLSGAVVSVKHGRAWILFVLLLALPALLVWIVDLFVVSNTLAVLRQLFAAAFLGYVIWDMFHFIYSSRQVTYNTVCASLCIYLLLGIIWALVYSVVDMLDPEAFTCTVPAKGGPPLLRVGNSNTAVLYFSFSTLTTLGYGDIAPTAPISRMLASMEAIVGQLYLAVLVARLVGLHIAESFALRGSNETEGLRPPK